MNPSTIPTARSSKAGLSRSIIERVVLVVVLAGSLSAIWWSATRLIALQKQSSELNQKVSKLNNEIDIMRMEWSPARTQELTRRFGGLHENLFDGVASTTEWTEAVVREAVPLALDLRVSLGTSQVSTNDAGTVTRVPAILEIRPNSAALPTRTIYHRLIDWSRQIANQPRRIDFLELNLIGIGANGGTMSAAVELWALDRSPTEDPAGTPPASSPGAPTPNTNAPAASSQPAASASPTASAAPPASEPKPQPQALP